MKPNPYVVRLVMVALTTGLLFFADNATEAVAHDALLVLAGTAFAVVAVWILLTRPK